jgi:hypothetical protein
MESEAAVAAADEVTAELAAVLGRLGALADGPEGDGATDADRIDRITLLERIRSAAAATQYAEMVRFGRSQVEKQIADGTLDPTAVGRGIGDQIALACRVSPFTGSRRLGMARALHADLPGIRALLTAGRISEDTAAQVVGETSHLDGEQRRRVDAALCAGRIDELAPRRAAALARRHAYEADPAGYVARGRTARGDRRVTLRPAPDTMSLLTGFLPVEQGVACLAALRRHSDALLAAGDDRGRGQIMADTLVERLTGQAHAADVNVEVGIVMPLNALIGAGAPTDGPTTRPGGPTTDQAGGPAAATARGGGGGCAELVGHGPVPAGIARDLLQSTEGNRWWRRLFTMPDGGPLVGADSRRRAFDGVLAALIGIRDGGRCRDPFCDAPIRHLDHIRPYRAGGPTSLANGRGVCARGNYVREMPGWHVELVDDGHTRHPHTVRTTTPTGHTYTSRAGPAP